MAIVKMKKLTLAAPRNDRDKILRLLQSKGCVQVIDLEEQSKEIEGVEAFGNDKAIEELEYICGQVRTSYEFLRRYIAKKPGLFEKKKIMTEKEFQELGKSIDWENICGRCRDIEEKINQNKNSISKSTSLIEQYTQWINLDVCSCELNELKRVAYLIGSISKKYEDQLYEDLTLNFKDIHIEKISEKQQDVNVFLLFHSSESSIIFEILKKYGFNKINMDISRKPSEQIDALNEEIKKLNRELDELARQAEEMAVCTDDIEKVLDYYNNRLETERTNLNLLKTQSTFILCGWIPSDKAEGLEKLLQLKMKDVFISFEEPVGEDEPPVVLKNNVLFEPFEAITSMYALPLPGEVDPTPVLAPFYLLFFGMMAGDIGYGAVLLLISSFALKFMDFEGQSRKILKILQYCSIPTMIFGWIFGGFFGDAVKIKPLWVNPVDDPMKVLYVSAAIGIVHLFTGLGVKGYSLIKAGKVLDAVYDVLFWYMLLSGLLWMLLVAGRVSGYIAIAGALGLLFTQGRANETLVGKFFGGLFGLYGVTSYIGDILSYSRLLALGLATGLIGSSFNLLMKLLGNGAFALILGAVVFIFGHTFNLLMGMLGTFVHTCRLEYLEFFGKFYEGGGKAFEPLKINTKFIKVNTEK